MKGCQKYSHHTFFFSVIAISKLHNLQDQIRTLLGRNVGKSKGNKIKMGEGKFKKCFQDLSECQLFLEFPFNKKFFFSPLLLLQNSIPSFHFTSQNLMRTLFIFFFLTLFPSSFFSFFLNFFFLSSLNSRTNHHIETN